ncbi:MAG TPA: DNA polymerase III subunit delta' [Xanthomonadaceae bacterium]|jgi:DNA polymerase-3 subunit delta'|nr:DNA polymerase III subunit delta' [Xanthomonadaceae bacterium]
MELKDLAPWLHAPLRRALDALASDRLGHALLVCGPAHIGKHAFADALAQTLVCRERVDGIACGCCRDCAFHAAGTHPDERYVGIEENEKTKVLRKEIVVEQLRDLGAWFALTPQRGGAQVARIEPASAMNANASNALLKTLEEPIPGRYLLLLCESPMQLSATVRSRCQRILLQPPDAAAALDWLRARGHEPALAQSALASAHGHPGLAAHWIDQGLLALRETVRSDLAALAADRARPLEVAVAWLADARAEQRLAFAADLAVDLQAQVLGIRPQDAWRVDRVADLHKLSVWFDSANRTRELLRTPIRADLAIAGLLRDWRDAVAA